MTKAEVMKAVSEYIKTKNLQLQDNKRKFLPDSKLAKIFSIRSPVVSGTVDLVTKTLYFVIIFFILSVTLNEIT